MRRENSFLVIAIVVVLGIIGLVVISLILFFGSGERTRGFDWENDGIDLALVKETGEYQCFGCSNTLCVDPLLDAIEFVEETSRRYCNSDFEVVE